jgi:membrane protease YdiL (CAAX protease family)
MISLFPARDPAGDPGAELRDRIMAASWISGFLWLLTGSLLVYFFHSKPAAGLLLGELPFWQQLPAGLFCGLMAGYLASAMMKLPRFRHISRDYPIVDAVRKARLSTGDIYSISVTAGITEEWLFRAALQPVLGLWISSLIFVALHGYFKFKNTAQMLFGGFMMLLSLMLGMLFEYAGLLSAITAHAAYDVKVTRSLKDHPKSEYS